MLGSEFILFHSTVDTSFYRNLKWFFNNLLSVIINSPISTTETESEYNSTLIFWVLIMSMILFRASVFDSNHDSNSEFMTLILIPNRILSDVASKNNWNLSENYTIFDYKSAPNILILIFNFLVWNSDSVFIYYFLVVIVILIFWYGNPDSVWDSNSDYVILIKL